MAEATVLTLVRLPVPIREALEAESERSDRPMSRVIIEALREKLGVK